MKAKLLSTLIIAPIVVGTVFLANMGELTQLKEVMPNLFICFFGLIIAVQAIPAIMLFVVLIREIVHKETRPKDEASADIGQGG